MVFWETMDGSKQKIPFFCIKAKGNGPVTADRRFLCIGLSKERAYDVKRV